MNQGRTGVQRGGEGEDGGGQKRGTMGWWQQSSWQVWPWQWVPTSTSPSWRSECTTRQLGPVILSPRIAIPTWLLPWNRDVKQGGQEQGTGSNREADSNDDNTVPTSLIVVEGACTQSLIPSYVSHGCLLCVCFLRLLLDWGTEVFLWGLCHPCIYFVWKNYHKQTSKQARRSNIWEHISTIWETESRWFCFPLILWSSANIKAS